MKKKYMKLLQDSKTEEKWYFKGKISIKLHYKDK